MNAAAITSVRSAGSFRGNDGAFLNRIFAAEGVPNGKSPAEEVAGVLGIGIAHAYEVARRRDFPTIKIGSRIIVPRDRLIQWLEEQAD